MEEEQPMALGPSVISVQSQVAYGHVGNSVATFVLQRCGVEVIAVPTVLYSSHLGHACWRGRPVEVAHVEELFEGLAGLESVLHAQRALLMGFLGSVTHGEAALRLLEERLSPECLVVCDPVMGDQGRFYVSQELVRFYADRASLVADVITPNVFELGVLSGLGEVDSVARASQALSQWQARLLAAGGKREVLLVAKGVSDPRHPDTLHIVARRGEEEVRVSAPKILRDFTGAGDLFAASLTARLVKGANWQQAVRWATRVSGDVLAMTERLGREELTLVAAQRVFDTPLEGR